jgi:CubicO group peptidase (beta-lactamase class C family)
MSMESAHASLASDEPVAIGGEVAAGFKAVRARFAECVFEVGAGGAAFAAVVDGELVVDLWAGSAGANPWCRHTRGVLMSATKGVVSAAVACLVDRGELELDRPVAYYWPEFAAEGKAEVTVAQLLAHRAGVVTVPEYEQLLTPEGEGWDQTEEIAARLALAAPAWPPDSAFGYHGITFGWLVGEVVRRVTGRSVGTVVRELLAEPLGLELELGTPVERQGLVAPVILPGGIRPPQPGTDELFDDPASLASRMLLTVDGRSLLDTAPTFFANPRVLATELAGSNATGTARALATLYGALATARQLGPEALVSAATLGAFTAERSCGTDVIQAVPGRFGAGFALAMPPADGRAASWGPHQEAFGHPGYGGQAGFADPVDRIGVGFVRSSLSHTSPLASALVDALYRCLSTTVR